MIKFWFTGIVEKYLVVDGPTDVLEVGVVQELVGELLHPLTDLVHADGSKTSWLNV